MWLEPCVCVQPDVRFSWLNETKEASWHHSKHVTHAPAGSGARGRRSPMQLRTGVAIAHRCTTSYCVTMADSSASPSATTAAKRSARLTRGAAILHAARIGSSTTFASMNGLIAG